MTNNDIEKLLFTITQNDLNEFKRLDTYLTSKLPDISRNLIKKHFLEGRFTSEQKLELKKMPKIDTQIDFLVPELRDVDIKPQNIPLEFIYQDEHLAIINKPAGLVVHPAPGNYDGTLVNAILYHCPDLKGIGNERRPGIVHRLDKGTTGIMVIAKDQKTHEGLVKLFSTHDITRKYQAICLGAKLPQKKTLESTIGRNPNNRLKMMANVKNGKNAITHMKIIEYFKKLSHVELKLETGRTHQIRVHLSQLLHTPIFNDRLYGRTKEEKVMVSSKVRGIIKDYEHPFLHAKVLGFKHPITGEELYFEKEPPQIFQDVLKQLEIENG
jgi:23S rRNA pseudouridine1911/1915/1917 synthase